MTEPVLSLAGGQRARGLAISPRATASERCVHRWRYEEPNGTWARGECRYCGAETWGRNGDPMDYTAESAPTGEGMNYHRLNNETKAKRRLDKGRGGRKHDWSMSRFVTDCPHCGQRCDTRGVERHIERMHPEVAR